MMDEMKLLLFVLAAAAALAGDVTQAHSVYILPMAGGLDQYLANHLTQAHVLQVVTDPSKADAVLSDRLGSAFEQKMTELYPPPAPPKPEPAAARPMLGDTVNKLSAPTSSFGGGKGTVFLVSVKTRDVLWSTYEKRKDASAGQMEKVAARICDDLKKSMGGK